jgi:hypothetical protein
LALTTLIFTACALATAQTAPQPAPDLGFPKPTSINKPWTRWWWPGNAVDNANLTRELESFAAAGIGGVEITPIYGVHGAEDRFIDFLSPQYMALLEHTGREAKRLGLRVDMATGTGWPFGGPWVRVEDADTALNLDNGALEAVPTRMQVKRAAPGGAGNVLDPFCVPALERYLQPFDKVFAGFPAGLINAQFHDSFEYKGNWTRSLPDVFQQMHGYSLADALPELAGPSDLSPDPDTVARVKSDYRETLSKMHIDYVNAWVAWCHARGFVARNQAHGAPANLLDLYAATDTPETEIFGSRDYPIPFFRRERRTIRADLDNPSPLITRVASSAAHVAGKPLTSSETFTWLREHFNVSLTQAKPELDTLFLAGINHVLFHGACYSPADAAWPGWLFYASTQFNDRNTLWRNLPAFNDYIARCQSILQGGKPDNDILVYWPVHDVWHDPEGLAIGLTVHRVGWLDGAPCGDIADQLNAKGYAYDFISDAQLRASRVEDGQIVTVGGMRYKTLIVPPVNHIPVETLRKVLELSQASVLVVDHLPTDVPGLADLEKRRAALQETLASVTLSEPDAAGIRAAEGIQGFLRVGPTVGALLATTTVRREPMADAGLQCIRRATDAGTDYFIANLTDKSFDGWTALGAPAASIAILDPMTGAAGIAATRKADNKTEVYLQLAPGESLVLRASPGDGRGPAWRYLEPAGNPRLLAADWKLAFADGGAEHRPFNDAGNLVSWTDLGEESLQSFAGSGTYRLEFDAGENPAGDYLLDLGDVRESARVRLNGRPVATLWGLPMRTRLDGLKPGENVLEVEVTNLAANKIRDYDRRGVEWKIMYDANIVNIGYRPFSASDWPLAPSGLLGPVTLTPMKVKAL